MKKLLAHASSGQAEDDVAQAKRAATNTTDTGSHPPIQVPLQYAHESLRMDREVGRAVRRIPLPLLYFSSFVVMLFAHVPASSMFEQGFGVSSTLASAGDDTVTDDSTLKFYNIGEISDVFEWLTDSFVPAVFVTEDYNGHTLTQDRWGRVAMFNKVLGAVDLQVTRQNMHECETQPFLAELYPYCYDASNTTVERRLISFDTNVSTATTVLAQLKARGDWLDFSTQQLVITVVTFNGELQGYAVTQMQLEFFAGGYIEASSSTTPALSDPYQATATVVLDIIVIFFFLLTLGMQFRRAYQHRSDGVAVTLFGNVWTFIEHAASVMVGAFYAVWLSIVRLMYLKEFRENLASLVVSGKNWTDDEDARTRLTSVIQALQTVAKLTTVLRLVATFAVFLLGLRILKRFRFHPRLSILTRTVANALHQFGAFFVVFVVIFVTFAVSGTVLFGDRVSEFSSLQMAMESCVNMLFGDFNYDSIQNLYAPVSMIYYWGYMIVVSLVLLNMMLAIVLDAYADVSSESYKTHANLTFSRIFGNILWDLALAVHDSKRLWRRCNQHEVSAKTSPRVAGVGGVATNQFAELPRDIVIFRGRIRPELLERALHAMFQKASKLDGNNSIPENDTQPQVPTMVTPRTLVEVFAAARVQETEAVATLQHVADGIVLPTAAFEEGEHGQQQSVGGKTVSVGDGNDSKETPGKAGVVVPVPSGAEGPNKTDISAVQQVATDVGGTVEASELQLMAAKLAAVEWKLDLLLAKTV